jgi:hypothetical protein
MDELRAAVRRDQLGSFVRLKGGFPFPLAGAACWAVLGAFFLWNWMPHDRFTLIPFWVAAVCLGTVAAILMAWKREAAARTA